MNFRISNSATPDQRLDVMSLTVEGVPQQESDRAADRQQGETAHKRGYDADPHRTGRGSAVISANRMNTSYQVAHRNMADVGTEQIGFAPAHQQSVRPITVALQVSAVAVLPMNSGG
ncbi:MAG: hypothetical protein IPL59_25290 [Candidatus Competibacteraceae bacterium]|nr:hypothetical protein [Candidatus Competibacteraceae bacterium]